MSDQSDLLKQAMSNVVEAMVQDWAAANRPASFEYDSEYLTILDIIGGLLARYEGVDQ